MKQSLWNQRIPTLLGMLLIAIGIGVTSFLVSRGIITIGRAGPSQNPQAIRITNISDTSFTVSYKTSGSVPGSVAYGTTKELGQVALDDRDQQSGSAKNYQIHSITLRNLQPNTPYFFSITSGDSSFLNNGEPFTLTTASKNVINPTQQQPLTGKVITTDAKPPAEAIVYLSVPNAQTLSILTKPDGSFIIPLNTLLNKSISAPFPLTQDTSLSLLILGQTEKSNVELTVKQSNPVPVITLSQNYDFAVDTFPLDADKSIIASQAAEASFPFLSASEINTNITPQVISPKNDETFTDQQPVFRGTASPNSDVIVVINSDEQIQSKVKTNANGSWSFRPQTKLSPGEHTLSVSARDNLGILNTITRSFTVHAQGTQVNQSATPSATPKIAIMSPTPTLFVLSTPTISAITPTTIPSQIVLLSPTSPLGGTTKGGEPIQPPGSTTLVTISIGAIITTIVGILLFVLI